MSTGPRDSRRPEAGLGSFRIGRIAGIDILVHWSWFAIFILLTWWLSEGWFQKEYDGWSKQDAWAASVITVLLFFSSILLHELSHSLVAKRLGLPVSSITLFIFGGVSALGEEPSSAKQELGVAIAGPLTSLALAAVFGALAGAALLTGRENTPPAAVVTYLAIINVSVGIFNMMPGFPLDGGRVLRATLWARSGDMLKATRWASGSGSVISFGLIGIGVLSILAGSYIGGVWFIVIGWFLRNASESSYQQLVFRHTLTGVKVRDVVNTSYASAPPDISLSQLVSDYIFGFSQRCIPVVVADDLLGLVSMSDLKRVPPGEWPAASVFKAMTPREKLHVVSPEDDLTRALEVMAANDVHQLPVLDRRTFLGFVTRADVLRLVQIRTDLSGSAKES